MAETLILNAAVAVATVYENKARATGKPFWNVVTDTKDRFTAFSRDIVAHLIDGRTPTVIEGQNGAPNSLAYNLNPPLNTMVFFEARAAAGGFSASKVLVPTPEGVAEPPGIAVPRPVQMPPPNPPGTRPLPDPPVPSGQQPAAYPAAYKPPYRANAGYQKAGGGWKPEDKRPGLVTMTAAYSKDLVVAIIGNSDDLKAQDPESVAKWATEQTLRLSKVLLTYVLGELTALDFKVRE